MKIELDYNPSPKQSFFITVPIGKSEDICFDNTDKRVGIIKQVAIETKSMPPDLKIDEQWKTIVLEDGKFIRMNDVNWVDKGEVDWCNDKVFKCVWERPLPNPLKEKLQFYSHLICDNYKNLDQFSKEMDDFEDLLKSELGKCQTEDMTNE